MADQVPDFPLPVRMVYERDGSAKASFLADVAQMTGDAQRQFDKAFGEIEGIIQRSISGFRTNSFSFAIDLPGLRKAAADAQFATQRLAAMRDAAVRLARTTGDTSAETTRYIQALRAQVIEAERAQRSADAQVASYSRLQAEIDRTARKNEALAASYRATFAEEARAANFAFRSQSAVNAGFAPGLGRTAKSARASAEVFENIGYKPAADLRSAVDRLREGEAAIDRAALSGATLERVLGRVANRGEQVSAALRQAGEAAARSAAEQAAADTRAAAARDSLARATATLRAQLDPTFAAQQRLTQQMDLLDRALAEGVIDMQAYGNAVSSVANQFEMLSLGAKHGTDAAGNVINSQRSMRVAVLQSGQQLQDLVISLYSGQQASVVFAQQLPQLAFALTGLEGSANKTHDRIGRIATFLSGPWGLAVGLAVGATASLLTSLLNVGEEAEKAEKKTFDFSKSLDVLALSAKDSATAMEQLRDATRAAIQEQGDFLLNQKSVADDAVSAIEGRLSRSRQELERLRREMGGLSLDPTEGIRRASRITDLRASIASDQSALSNAREAQIAADIALSQRRVADSMDAAAAATTKYKEAVGDLNKRLDETRLDPIGAQLAGRAISQGQYESELRRLRTEKDRAVEAARAAERATKTDTSGRDARIGDMVALVKQLFPGASITSTTGGKHASDSDHYAGRAIDFVPRGGMGRYTTAEVERILEDAGVDIRRNARGTKQIFGPGRYASTPGDHDDHFHVAWKGSPDPEKIADAAQRAQDRLTDFGQRAAESIARLNERFDEQPRLIDQASGAARQLDAIIAELTDRKPPGFEKLIADAERARTVIADALVRPIRELERDTQRRLDLDRLILAGKEAEARALQNIWRLTDQIGALTEDHKRKVIDLAHAEQGRIEALERARELQGAYLEATRSARAEVEAILSGQGKLSNFKQIFRNLQGKVLADQLFGDVFDDLDKWVKERTGIGSSVDALQKEVDRSGNVVSQFADAVAAATARISNPGAASGSGAAGAVSAAVRNGASAVAAGALFRSAAGAAANDNSSIGPDGEIVVTARKPGRSVNDLTPEEYFDRLTSDLSKGLTDGLNGVFGTTFFSRFSGVLSGGLAGYATGGAPGGIFGALKEIKGLPKGISDALGKAGSGAATGSAVAGIGKALGIGLSTTGSQIGGAIGSFLPIPGGDIIGAIAGGIIGKLIGGHKTGKATIGDVNGSLGIASTGGNKGSYIRAASSSADGILASVERIAEAFGASVNSALGSVTIGIRDGKYRVNTDGTSLKTSGGATNFGKNGAEEAARYATLNLIQDGVIVGLRQGVQKILKESKDLDKGLQDALDFQSIFDRLKAIKDPVGAALDTVDREFSRLRKLAEAAGEGMAEVEELYLIERQKAIDTAKRQVTASLQGLLDDLTIGDSGLSLRSRLASARSAYDPLKARVQAGDVTAYDDFAGAAQTMLGIARELYGSQNGYFDLFNEVKNITKGALDATTAIAESSANRDSPFSSSAVPAADNSAVVSAIDAQTQALVATLQQYGIATQQNLAALIEAVQAGATNDAALLAAVGNGWQA